MSDLRNFLESKGFYRIPLKKLKSGHYRIIAKVNGNTGSFILDTGASTSCIGFEYVEHFALDNEASEVKAAGAGAIDMETEMAFGNNFQMGNWHISKMPFVIFDLTHVNEALRQVDETAVQGIIGSDFLKQVRAVIDYGRNALYVK